MAYLIKKDLTFEGEKDESKVNPPDYFLISDLAHATTKWNNFTVLPTSVKNILPKYREVVNDNIVEKNQAGKDAADQVEADAAAQAAENAKDFEIVFDKIFKAFALVILDEINALRSQASLSNRTKAQLNNAVKAKYDTL